MNKKLAAFFVENGMTVEKNKAYGNVEGYEVSAYVKTLDYTDPLKIHIAFYGDDAQRMKIADLIKNAKFKCISRVTRYGLYVGLNAFSAGSLAKKMPEIFKYIFGVLKKSGVLGAGYCPICGDAIDPNGENVKKCTIDGFAVTMEEKCVQALNAELQAMNAEFDKAPNNYGKGFAGALIGGIAGGLIAALFYVIGFVTAVSAIVAVFLGAFLYQKFGGKPNKMMILIVSVTALVCMLIAFFAVYLVAARIALNDLGLLASSAFEGLALALEDAAFSRMFYSDLALMFGFSLLGIGLMIFYLGRKFKRKKNIEQ